MVNAATFAVAAAVATTAFAAPSLEARRRGGRGASRVSQSSRTDKIAAGIGAAQLATDVVGLALPKRDLEFVEVEARRRRAGGRSGPRSSTTDKISAGIGAAQLATDVAGLVIPKDVDSADFEARDFSDDELEARDLEELEARRFKVKTLNIVKDPKTGQGFVKNKRDLEFVEVEARRRRAGGRSGPRSSTTDKITAGIGAAQLATDVAGLVIPKDIDSADFEARDFSDDKLEARDFEDLEARRFKVKPITSGKTVIRRPKRDLEFVEVEARRRRSAGSRGIALRGGIDRPHVAAIQPAVMRRDLEELEARRRRAGGARRGSARLAVENGQVGTGGGQMAPGLIGLAARDFEDLEARRRRAGGRSGPRSSTTAKIQAGIDGAQLATDVVGLALPKRDLEFVEVEARRRRGAGSRGSALRSGGARTHVATIQPDVMRRDFEELEARRRRAGGARRGPRSSTTDKISAGIGAAQLATDVAGLVTAREFDLEMLD